MRKDQKDHLDTRGSDTRRCVEVKKKKKSVKNVSDPGVAELRPSFGCSLRSAEILRRARKRFSAVGINPNVRPIQN